MQPVYVNNLPPLNEAKHLAAVPRLTQLDLSLLTDRVSKTWQLFTPPQSEDYIQKDNTRKTLYGHYLLFANVEQQQNDIRGIVITQRFTIKPDSRAHCFQLAIFKPDDQSVLEVYQGESGDEKNGIKVWDIRRATRDPQSDKNDWEVFNVFAQPYKNSSIDLFFYIVS